MSCLRQDGREEDHSEESHPTLRNLSTETNAGDACWLWFLGLRATEDPPQLDGLSFHRSCISRRKKKMSGQQGLGILSPSRNSQFFPQALAGGKPSRWSAPAGIFPRAPPWKVPTEHWPGNSPHDQQTLGWLMAREASH